MKTPEIVKRLVKEIGAEPNEEDENLPIEYYELREIAKTRVLLKSSFKTHLFIYGLVNIFLIVLNLWGGFHPIDSFTDLWSLWSVLGWGLILVAHGIILATYTITNLEYRIFVITSVIAFYIAGFLVFVNFFAIAVTESERLWWYWPIIAIFLFVAGYAWIVFYSENKEKFNSRISQEMEYLMEKSEEKEENLKQKKELEKNSDNC